MSAVWEPAPAPSRPAPHGCVALPQVGLGHEVAPGGDALVDVVPWPVGRLGLEAQAQRPRTRRAHPHIGHAHREVRAAAGCGVRIAAALPEQVVSGRKADDVDLRQLDPANRTAVATQEEALVGGRPGQAVHSQLAHPAVGLDHVGMVVGEPLLVACVDPGDPCVLDLHDRTGGIDVYALGQVASSVIDEHALDVHGAGLAGYQQAPPVGGGGPRTGRGDRDVAADQRYVSPADQREAADRPHGPANHDAVVATGREPQGAPPTADLDHLGTLKPRRRPAQREVGVASGLSAAARARAQRDRNSGQDARVRSEGRAHRSAGSLLRIGHPPSYGSRGPLMSRSSSRQLKGQVPL